VPAATFTATLQSDEAVLRFPYDDGLRRLLRAIPGRRWDPTERAWRLPLEAEQAEALARLLDGLPSPPDVDERLARTIERRRRRRGRRECLVDLARPDERWWLSFSTDGPPELLERLLDHPEADRLDAIGRAHVPLDDDSAATVRSLRDAGLRLSEAAAQALRQRERKESESPRAPAAARHDVEFRRDRRGEHWILIGGRLAALARVLAARAGLRGAEGPAGSVGLAASERDAEALQELLGHLEDASVDERVRVWLTRATSWRGNIDVGRPSAPGEPAELLLLGEFNRLPRAVRESARETPGGASLPLTLASWRLAGEELDGWISPAARRCGRALEDGRPAPPAVLELSTAHEQPTFVLAPGHDSTLAQAFAAMDGVATPRAGSPRRPPGTRADHAALPAISADPFCVPELDRFLDEHGVWVEPGALALLQEAREEHARSAGLVALSAAHDAELEVAGLGGELKPFQRAGVAYLLERRRAFLADEQGLGKTIEALAALQADEAFPAVVVCPANLKLNWERETRVWLPGRSVERWSGLGARGHGEEQSGAAEPQALADITIVNFDILAARLPELLAGSPRALVIDEAHLCKNAGAKRTQAAQRLAAAIPLDGLVLALSGTPVVNRPAELVAQLRILGRLDEFGSGARFSARFKGPDAHQRLHWHLRARCFARRLKRDVLPQLPAKTRSVVPIELDNEAEYRLAERDLVAWLRSQPLDLRDLDAKVAAALRAERLVRLNALKLLAARGKLAAALAWLHDFRCSGEPLVVFARHREIQRAVIERFPEALHILGEDSQPAREGALRAFQEGEGEGMIVCSLEVAGQGLTLTRASSVAFLELDWTPARHDQAEDRCHRIGQRDAVNAYYLLAAETVDETIARLLERKRSVIGAVTDGLAEDAGGVLDALVRELRGAAYRHLRAVA
jgi:superfamily II DNA or RNA helicase